MRSPLVSAVEAVWDLDWLQGSYLRLRRAGGSRPTAFLGFVFVGVLLALFLAFLLIQDVARSDEIFRGTTINGEEVGGLSRADAKSVVEGSVAGPITSPLVLYHDDGEFSITAEEIDLSVDIDGMLDKAFWAGRSRVIFERMYRRLFNRPITEDVPVMFKYDVEKLRAKVAAVAAELNRDPRSAGIDMSRGSPSIKPSLYGLTVDQEVSFELAAEALPTRVRRVPIAADSIRPNLTEGDINKIVVVKQSEYTLYLYEREKLLETFTVAVGSEEYPTPNGKFYIVYKEKDPTWYPPDTDWARDKEPIPPGPDNPLGPYWMALGGGLGIHSTPHVGSLGYSVSHGCIRMSEYGAMRLFNAVNKGTPVYVLP